MPRSCGVKGCKGSAKQGCRFFTIPKGARNAIRRQKWLSALNRPSDGVYKQIDVCEKHFCKEDMDLSFKFSSRISLRLKNNAVPHLNLSAKGDSVCHCKYDLQNQDPSPFQDTPIPKIHFSVNELNLIDSQPIQDKRHETRPIEDQVPAPVIRIANIPEACVASMDSVIFEEQLSEEKLTLVSSLEDKNSRLSEVAHLRDQNTHLRQENEVLKRENIKLKDEIKKLKSQEYKFLNEDQIMCMRQGSARGHKWSNETLVTSSEIRLTCGGTGYDLLRDLGYPLPSQRTLRENK